MTNCSVEKHIPLKYIVERTQFYVSQKLEKKTVTNCSVEKIIPLKYIVERTSCDRAIGPRSSIFYYYFFTFSHRFVLPSLHQHLNLFNHAAYVPQTWASTEEGAKQVHFFPPTWDRSVTLDDVTWLITCRLGSLLLWAHEQLDKLPVHCLQSTYNWKLMHVLQF